MSTEPSILGTTFRLPCGHVMPNRFMKAAMTEQMSDAGNAPTESLIRLYARWGRGGCGALLTGNVMVDRRSLEGPRNVAVEDERDLPLLKCWATEAQAEGSQLWMQISHPGRQTPRGVSSEVVAPSAVPLGGRYAPLFQRPRALTEAEIESLIARFGATAAIAKAAGFAGVQIHSAHGYLISQFLSPLTNHRTDAWGGSLENRARFLLEIVRRVRASTGPAFPIAVKLNSADFQRGGFSEAESMEVVCMLEAAGIDLLEVSGGTYERPVMMGTGTTPEFRESTRLREAFFLEYAQRVRQASRVPLMLTGGLRSPAVMEEILCSGAVDIIGIARPLALDPDFCAKAIAADPTRAPDAHITTGVRMLDDLLQSLWHQEQFKLMAAGKDPDPRFSKWLALGRGLRNIFLHR